MKKEDTKIREALERYARMKWPKTTDGAPCIDELIAMEALAELDESEQPRVALTKPIIEVRKVLGEWAAHFTIGNQTFCLQPCGEEEDAAWYGDMLRKAFSNLAPAAGLTVEGVMEVVEEFIEVESDRGGNARWTYSPRTQRWAEMIADLRARLAAAMNAKTKKP